MPLMPSWYLISALEIRARISRATIVKGKICSNGFGGKHFPWLRCDGRKASPCVIPYRSTHIFTASEYLCHLTNWPWSGIVDSDQSLHFQDTEEFEIQCLFFATVGALPVIVRMGSIKVEHGFLISSSWLNISYKRFRTVLTTQSTGGKLAKFTLQNLYNS